MHTSVTLRAPASLTASIAAALEWPDARARHERQHAVEHADARAEDGADGDLLPGDALRRHLLERRLDLPLLRLHVLRRLVGEQQRHLVDELPEVDGRRLDVAQVRKLVLHERMLDDGHPLRLHGRGHVTYVVYPRKPG
jgi:hypothetical protein